MNTCLPCLKVDDHQQEKGKGEEGKGQKRRKKVWFGRRDSNGIRNQINVRKIWLKRNWDENIITKKPIFRKTWIKTVGWNRTNGLFLVFQLPDQVKLETDVWSNNQ